MFGSNWPVSDLYATVHYSAAKYLAEKGEVEAARVFSANASDAYQLKRK